MIDGSLRSERRPPPNITSRKRSYRRPGRVNRLRVR